MDTTVVIPALYMLTGRNASGTDASVWYLLDWGQITRSVKSLQVRTAKAVKQKQWRKLSSLQWMLTHNLAAKLLAVKRVTENAGKRTPGTDGQLWRKGPEKLQGALALKLKGYEPKPVRRIYIPKSNGKKRPLGIPTIRDRAMQALHLQALDPVSETLADANSYGFRPYRSCADAIARCFSILAKQQNAPEWILEGDIKGCFDNISHVWMLANIPMHQLTLCKWLEAGFVEQKRWFPSPGGTPQGSVISPTLANMVLDSMEAYLDNALGIKHIGTKVDRRINPDHVHLVRYADDFIVTASSVEILHRAKACIREFLAERGLELSEEKTSITHIDAGFDFLGQHIKRYKGKLVIQPARKNVHTFLQNIRRTIKRLTSAPALEVIDRLTPMIRGWALYHQHISAAETFQFVDHEIQGRLWRWAKRRHSHRKNALWIKNRYFRYNGKANWVFFAKDEDGNTIDLFRAASIKIERHVKIQSDANPYDPEYELYFERRQSEIMYRKLAGRRLLKYLYTRQAGKCALCDQPITPATGWDRHHLTPKYMGGHNTDENLVLLHPDCHVQVHHENLHIPAPPRRPSGNRVGVRSAGAG